MELGIVTVMHGRHALTRMWAEYTSGLGLPIFACITNGDVELRRVCDDHGIVYVERSNDWLGAKHNAALSLCGAGRVMLLPSDDFVSPSWIDVVRATDVPYLYPDSCGLYDVATRRGCILRHRGPGTRRFGAGRVLRRDVLDMVGTLWTDRLPNGLDSDSHGRVSGAGFDAHVAVFDGVPVVDIKAGENIWPFSRWARGQAVRCDGPTVMASLPEQVRERLLALC